MALANRKWALGLAAAAMSMGLAAAAEPEKAVVPAARVEAARAADPLGAMLSDARASYAKVRDYSCVFTRQERLQGVLGAEQVAEMKVRVKPASVAIRFAKPDAAAGMEFRHTALTKSGKMRFRAAGAKGLSGFQSVKPDDSKIMAENRHPVTAFGVGPTLDLLASIAAREKALGNPLEVFTSDFNFAGKVATRYEIFAHRAHVHRYAYRMLVYVDKETKLPMRFESYDAPPPGSTVGELLESYSYTGMKLNVGLGESAFE
jgi:hypothetical protein